MLQPNPLLQHLPLKLPLLNPLLLDQHQPMFILKLKVTVYNQTRAHGTINFPLPCLLLLFPNLILEHTDIFLHIVQYSYNHTGDTNKY
jgi:hypothetical protein